ncbi:MAG: hypothetical protein K9M82_09980 [Deltaproteobacteria bacterium]|nr:hypothetical protein [Deltaproteobacteria bacterium]
MTKLKLRNFSFGKGIFLILLLFTSLTVVNQAAQAKTRTVLVEVFYLPHRPAEAVVMDIERLVAKFPGVEMKKFSFEDPANGKLLKKYGLTAHMPVVVFIDGKNEFTISGRSFHLKNFPKGNAFVPMFEGSWTYEDIEAILKSAIKGR